MSAPCCSSTCTPGAGCPDSPLFGTLCSSILQELKFLSNFLSFFLTLVLLYLDIIVVGHLTALPFSLSFSSYVLGQLFYWVFNCFYYIFHFKELFAIHEMFLCLQHSCLLFPPSSFFIVVIPTCLSKDIYDRKCFWSFWFILCPSLHPSRLILHKREKKWWSSLNLFWDAFSLI